jgi:two-component system CheB/CheR fusion protein
MAYVLVQHLDPSHESILSEILSRVTKIPVNEIIEDIHLAPDNIYVIPANKTLISTDGVLKLTPRDGKIRNLPIDVFFISLAEVHQSLAVGVVLSGTASDGTLGLKAIKEHGGISFAQDQESAAYGSMPQNAVDAGVVDFILPPEKIPAQLLQINGTYKTSHAFKEEEQLPKDDENIFKQILSLLHQRSSVDFTYYKQTTLRRRIARRMALNKTEKLSAYLNFLRKSKPEQDFLFQDVLIPVTSFFRDPKTFQTLCDIVFPVLFKNKLAGEHIRIWIAGCSTGEEAYSLAICLHEYLAEKLFYTRIQIFASDISETAIRKARAGIYSKADVEMLSDARLKNYFIKTDGGYEVSKLIRDMCVFASHNFLKDPPFAKIDLISCRNVLIYMDTFLQKKALTTFHYALKENGFLLLGKSETTSPASELFTPFTKQDKIYSRKLVPGRFIHIATEQKEKKLATKNLPASRILLTAQAAKNTAKQEAVQSDFRKSAETILLSKYTPAGVIVNEQMDIVHIHGTITPFLEPPTGKPTFNLLKMAREGLAFELRNTLHKAKNSKAIVIKEGIPVKTNGKQSLVTIEIIPLSKTVEPHFLILFNKISLPLLVSVEKSKSASASQKIKKDEARQRIQHLEKELSQTREDMRSITEDHEAANEELQSANEELQSSNEEMQSLNEEMQSLNEELETSKEELQSTNEELIIVNHELLDKQEQLNAARLYAENIITTIREPLIVLDKALRIKTANASFYKKFNIGEQETVRKLFYEIRDHQWDNHLLRSMLEKILPQRTLLIDYEIIIDLPLLGECNMLLNARQIVNEKTEEQLILLSIEDVTEKKIAEKRLQESEAKFKRLADANIIGVAFWNVNGNIADANEAFLNMLGYTAREMNDGILNWKKLTIAEDTALHESSVKKAISGKTIVPYHQTHYIHKDGHQIPAMVGFAMLPGSTENGIAFVQDITEIIEAEQAIKESAKRFKFLADAMPQKIWTADNLGNANYFNKRWFDYTKMSFEELRGWGWKKIIHPDDWDINQKTWQHSIDTGEDFQIEHRFLCHDGTYRWHLSRGLAQTDEQGNIIMWVGTNTDIDEKKKVEQQEEDFISIAGHELRTPVTSIKGYVQIIHDKFSTSDDSMAIELVNKLDKQVDRLTHLIKDLLDVTRIREGQLQLQETEFDINELINETAEVMQITTPKHVIVKELNATEKGTGDRERIGQVLINFISNAIKYAPDSDKIIVRSSSDGQNIIVCVQDFGIGVSEDMQKKVFDRFFRSDEKTSKTYPGLGLGLYISSEIIKRQNGKIWVTSTKGKGSKFYFSLPVTGKNNE